MLKRVRVRLTLWYVTLFGLLLAAFSIFVYIVLSRTLHEKLDQSLLNAASVVAAGFNSEAAEADDGAVSSAAQALNEIRMPGVYLAIFDGDQPLASSFDQDDPISIPKDMLSDAYADGRTSFRTLEHYRWDGARAVVTVSHTKGKDYLIAAAEPLHDLAQQLESIRNVFYFGFPVSLLIATCGGFILAKKSLAAVVIMSNQAEQISSRNLNERLKVTNKGDELGHLARVFNDLLSRLDQSFESMRAFMADASHELRTPLSIIRGEADVALSQERDASEYREALATIQDEARRLSRVVDDMMALARADAGQRPLRVQEFYLNDLVEECCKAARVLALHEGVSLTLEPSSDIPYQGDEDLLRRMILNLLDNATKYTPSGGSVSVKLEREPANIKITVSDTGIGIPVESAPHVFERFFRVDSARSRAEGGSGLGLAIAKWVAEAHEGSIGVNSALGAGSTFTVRLPGQRPTNEPG